MKTTTRQVWATFCLMCAALLLSTAFIACEESNDTEEILNPDEPVTPVNPDDWQTVPATGGTIEKGDITIDFPSGTFSKDEKVAVTETSANNLMASDPCSQFYQITLPKSGTSKDITISLKSDNASNARMIFISEGWDRHTYAKRNIFYELDATVSDGTISATLPVFSDDDTMNPYFYVGLAKKLGENAATRAEKEYRFKVTKDLGNDEYEKNKATYDKIEAYLNENIPIALEKLKQKKFLLPSWTIQYLIRKPADKKEADCWGTWTPNPVSMCFGSVFINNEKLIQFMNTPQSIDLRNQLQATLVHESVHAIHDLIYEPRSARKMMKDGQNGDEWAMLDEAMGGWVEKFWGDNIVGGQNTQKNLPSVIVETFPHEKSMETCRDHGYGLSAFIEYLAQKSGDDKLVKLYRYQNGRTLREALDKFMKEENINFFTTPGYYDFVIKAINGELLTQLQFDDLFESKKGIEKEGTFELKGNNVYNYGTLCEMAMIGKDLFSNKPKDVIEINQNNNGLRTYIYYNKGRQLELLGSTTSEKPFSISLTDYAKILGFNNLTEINTQQLFLCTFREENKDDNSTLPSDITINIVESEEVDNAIISLDLHYSVKTENEYGKTRNFGWSYSFEESTNAKYKVTLIGKKLHVECLSKYQDKWNESIYTDISGTLSFDIDDFSASGSLINRNATIKNCKFETTSIRTEFGVTSSDKENIEISNIPMYYNSVWIGKASDGVKFSNFYKQGTNYILTDDPDNEVNIAIMFSPDFLK